MRRLFAGQPPQLLVLGSAPGSPVLLHVAAKGFPCHLLWGKTGEYQKVWGNAILPLAQAETKQIPYCSEISLPHTF